MERWVNGSQLAKMKKSKTTVGYSDIREGPVSLLSSHPNKHELEPAVSSTVVNYTKPTNPNLTCETQNVYS